MSQRSNYGTLEDLPGVADAVLAKQMEALEGTLQRLHTQVGCNLCAATSRSGFPPSAPDARCNPWT